MGLGMDSPSNLQISVMVSENLVSFMVFIRLCSDMEGWAFSEIRHEYHFFAKCGKYQKFSANVLHAEISQIMKKSASANRR